MARVEIKLDHRGIGALLKSAEVAKAVGDVAASVHAHVARHHSVVKHEVEVMHGDFVTDRASAGVTLAHVAGVPIEVKYNVLTNAARLHGLDVTKTDAAYRKKVARQRKARAHKARMKTDEAYRLAYLRKREQARRKREANRLKRSERERERLREDDV